MREVIQKKQEGKKSRSDDYQTLQLQAKRCETLKTEWDLLFFSFRGARIFFRDVSFCESFTGLAGGKR